MANNQAINTIDLNELIFAQKNKEYGAYKLRKAYNKYLSIAMWIAVGAVVIATVGPRVYRLLNPEEDLSAMRRKIVQVTSLAEPPSIGEKQEVVDVEAPPPLKSTIKFTPPVVKADAEVTDEYIPTVDELKEVDPGSKTEEGVEGGIDYSLIEVEEKVVEEPKEEAPTYFVAVEEMPEPIGGIQAIQSKITYPEIARRAGVEGKVYILAFVNENGAVTGTKVIRGLGAGLDEAAQAAVEATKFKPGKQRGKPVKVQVSIPIVFKLQ